MSDRFVNTLKFLGTGVLWVYLLSINIGGHTIFHHANDILVKNQIVEAIDQQLTDTVKSVTHLASDGFAKISGRSKTL
jgi:hypothetical protein